MVTDAVLLCIVCLMGWLFGSHASTNQSYDTVDLPRGPTICLGPGPPLSVCM